jgi:hypothetical protein
MILGKRVVVVMPAYNAAKTLEQTVTQVDRQIKGDLQHFKTTTLKILYQNRRG